MKWQKKGLIYGPDGSLPWAKHSALTPTPILLNEDVIRVYAGFRDESGMSRIGYVDVDAREPSRVLAVSKTPALDIGMPGTFDDNGVILGDVISHQEQLLMFYVGFQKVEKVKFLAFTGFAVSEDGGSSFARIKKTPVLDRADESLYIRAIHSVMVEDGIWKVWYAAGSEWVYIDDTPYPGYHIKYTQSRDGLTFDAEGKKCLTFEGDEYRIGRPRVYKHNGLYRMFFTKGTLRRDYIPGYAESENGMDWIRKDEEAGIGLSQSGWDSTSLCYPSLLEYDGKTYMFYNGNNMGETGFGYAVLEEW